MYKLPETDGINPEIKNLYDALGQIVNELGLQKYYYDFTHSSSKNQLNVQVPDLDAANNLTEYAKARFGACGDYKELGYISINNGQTGMITFTIDTVGSIDYELEFEVRLYAFPVDKDTFLNPVPVQVTTYEPAKTEVLIVEWVQNGK